MRACSIESGIPGSDCSGSELGTLYVMRDILIRFILFGLAAFVLFQLSAVLIKGSLGLPYIVSDGSRETVWSPAAFWFFRC